MGNRFLNLVTSPAARDEQTRRGSRDAYARAEDGADRNNRLTGDEAGFIAARDSFYLASVNPDGWPYIQHRGGPKGFLRLLDVHHIGFADYRGNKQYLTVGNIATDDRVALFLTDYPNRSRLKLVGRMR
ncbi:MAG: pyridoxamine 5-phosphate oxidase, partial [Rhodobacterales bacterium 12-65-15]